MTYAEAQEAYAAYLNAWPRARGEYDDDELQQFVEDLYKAKREMEIAWLEEKCSTR